MLVTDYLQRFYSECLQLEEIHAYINVLMLLSVLVFYQRHSYYVILDMLPTLNGRDE